MNELLQNLIRLQSLELEETTKANASATIEELRRKIPPPVLGHYDRLLARGKKGIVAVRGQTCSGCHMHVPVGVIVTLQHGDDLQLCESCDRYLYLAATTEAVETPVKKRGRRSKAAALIPG